MSAGAEQIALLTEGSPLPFPALASKHIAVIADAICSAWNAAVKAWPATTAEDLEKALNGAVVTQLQILERRNSRFSSLVDRIGRGDEQYNYNGLSLEKRPDINIYLSRGRKTAEKNLPLHGECKIIDKSKGQTIGKYKKDGLGRFIKGDYGWTHVNCFMIAYVRDGTDAGDVLARALDTKPVVFATSSATHHLTIHHRSFAYLDRDPVVERPGDLRVVHLWLDGSGVKATPVGAVQAEAS